MKVREVIEVLSELNPDEVVLMSSDPEGNSYYLVRGIDSDASYDPDEGYRLETVAERDEEDYTPCVLIFP